MTGEPGFISITSLSLQARGRIDRLRGTFQDCLKSKLRIVGVMNDREANLVLWNLLPQLSRRFVVSARELSSDYRPVPDGYNPEEVFCSKYQRSVGKGNVVRFSGHNLQMVPTNGRLNSVKARIEVYERTE